MSQLQDKRKGDSPFSAERSADIRIVLCVVLSLAAMIVDHRRHDLETARDTLSTLIYPLQSIVQLPVATGQWVAETFARHEDVIRENQRLKQKLLFTNVQLQKLITLEAENRRLRMLLESSVNLPVRSGERVLVAELLTVDLDPYRHQILLNKGSRQGVRVGQPLLDERGIVGQIIHTGLLSSTAILITDPNHALPVQDNRNGLRALATGTGNFQELEILYVRNNEDVQEGDLFITSGLGGRFPPGYPVARVTKVEFDPTRPFAHIVAAPMAQLDRSREVLLIASEPESDPESEGVSPPPSPRTAER
ncbi:MAG: rod shape-determining protein MreC [Gammaproteobacteria bacterium]|nr:rod shape-determining protein MreC [Gammaproteobacteria bacterium]MCP5425116.1 rod shape-determining protein MreC [Gammaproteobacteria bacterium]MCP5459803.1 rod shape-determining protein MreC [Gammaproteobacteria bacterium]